VSEFAEPLLFAKVNENYNVTNCIDGFVVEVSGQDSNGTWVNGKFVFKLKISQLIR
jgi:hypothetical protein